MSLDPKATDVVGSFSDAVRSAILRCALYFAVTWREKASLM